MNLAVPTTTDLVKKETVTSNPHAKDGSAAAVPPEQPARARSARTKPHTARAINIGPWGNWGSSVLFIGLLPLFPMFAEWWDKHEVDIGTLTITAAIYAITVGVSSRWLFMLFAGIFAALIETFSFGTTINVASVQNPGSSNFLGMVITSDNSSRPPHAGFALVIIVSLLVSVTAERSLRHLKDREEFFEFIKITGE
jgi:hypothetical protein